MSVYALYFNKKMNKALRSNKDRIGNINAQVKDTLASIRAVKSFTNEEIEKRKVADVRLPRLIAFPKNLNVRPVSPGILTSYETYLRIRFLEGERTVLALFREITARVTHDG